MKAAILLAAYGSTLPAAREPLERLRCRIDELRPEMECRVACTSREVLRRTRQETDAWPSVKQALNQLVADGYTHVAIQSLHVIPGSEYQEILRAARVFRQSGALQRVCVGRPLLSSRQDVSDVAKALLEILPPLEDGHGVVVVAHGSSHPGRARLSDLLQKLESRGNRVLTETLEANGWSALVDRITRLELSKVWLYPLLLAPGRHLHRDILGPDPDSLANVLKENNVDSEVLDQSVAACDDVAAVWLGHLETALETMNAPDAMNKEEN